MTTKKHTLSASVSEKKLNYFLATLTRSAGWDRYEIEDEKGDYNRDVCAGVGHDDMG